ncbi:cytoplasmic protein [Gracilibacillus boraciitolerans JCM 21714]|uniref:Cytoplasmic protein n=1 Tax=Gracilibacillus boraciitolerans JCM 21714 TaxID=1298598 RepID=W4VMC1_9BACI|nr:hypothetical protein [Gracilibacillus boraciitolerans]GAE93943.1 cytoplasmic protein [Gracilibacillus boraciitolerans JCM 21714]
MACQYKKTGLISNLRFGESILLGRETVNGENVPGLYQDAFCLVSEVIEVKSKPSRPFGETGSNAFGERLLFKDNGMMNRAIIGLGRQDVMVKGLEPLQPVDIIGSSSDHIILNAKNMKISPGDLIKFSLNYGALLSVMTSPYIYKKSIYRKSSHAISKNLA